MDKIEIEQLIIQCNSGNPDLQVDALLKLSKLKIYGAVPEILKLLEGKAGKELLCSKLNS